MPDLLKKLQDLLTVSDNWLFKLREEHPHADGRCEEDSYHYCLAEPSGCSASIQSTCKRGI